jgi:hypothetical protein
MNSGCSLTFNGLSAFFQRILVSVAGNSVPICDFGAPVSALKFGFPAGAQR